MRALIVDPNAAEREVTTRTLLQEGYEAVGAADVAGASALLATRPDIVLVESTIANGDGIALLRDLRAQEQHTAHAFVVVTASRAQPDDMRTAFAAGADDFIRKPINPEELLLRVAGAARARVVLQKVHARLALLDIVAAADFLRSQSWASVSVRACNDVGEMLGMTLSATEDEDALGDAVMGAQLPLTMVSECFEVHLAVAVDRPSLRALAGALLGDEEAPESHVRDLLRELANVAAGSMKRAADEEGRVLTTGLPADGPPRDFRFPRAKAVRGWRALCGETGATLRFMAQYVTAENRHVPVAHLREGMVLAHDLMNPAGALLVRGGTRITEVHITQLPRMMGEATLIAVMAAAA